jgi:hypothetical protein
MQSVVSFLDPTVNIVAEENYGELVSLAMSECSGRATLIDELGCIIIYECANQDVGLQTSMRDNVHAL